MAALEYNALQLKRKKPASTKFIYFTAEKNYSNLYLTKYSVRSKFSELRQIMFPQFHHNFHVFVTSHLIFKRDRKMGTTLIRVSY